MRRTLLILLLAMTPAAIRAQEPAAPVQTLPSDVRRLVVDRWNGANEFRASDRADIGATSEIRGNVSVLRGPLTLAGHVTGNVLMINGDVLLAPTARIDGDLLVVGGDVDGLATAHVTGSTRIYRPSLVYREDGDRIVALNEEGQPSEENWWRRLERHREGNWSEAVRIVQAGPYNRVEGLPIQLGPAIQRLTPWGSVRFDGAAIIRTGTSFSSDRADVGHVLRSEVRIGRERGIGIGAQIFDDVEPIEAWQLSDLETALAAFLARRDYRDYYQRHGGLGSLTLYGARNLSLSGSFGVERWSSRTLQNPFTLFNPDRNWRPNPSVDEGLYHVGDLTLKFDTRTDPQNPWSGWFVSSDLEHARGDISATAQGSNLAAFAPGSKNEYTRGFFDVRRYNRLGPGAQLNMRAVFAGWLGGDQMPLERRVSVDGPGTLPGFGFRTTRLGLDRGNCNVGNDVIGVPAQCDRIALGQIEYRSDLKLPFSGGLEDFPRRYRRSHDDISWVLFADAGRGWLVDHGDGVRGLEASQFPALSTFRTDIGIGLDVMGLGVYCAKALSSPSEPVNFFVRLRHRF
ncbi:MAG TPA: hypothetical protein VGM82_18155 [Gemmatimonadaceae bacterium]|jgi:hypothetical protein